MDNCTVCESYHNEVVKKTLPSFKKKIMGVVTKEEKKASKDKP